MTKIDQLNKLFQEWQDRSSENIKRDGINNEQLFAKSLPKILFIMKEPNDPNKEADDYRKWWKKPIEGRFSHRLAEWSYGILNDFPEFNTFNDNIEAKHEAIQKIAFMNIKKVGGAADAEPTIMMKYTKEYLDLIQEEIEIIAPEIIILGVSEEKIRNELFPTVVWESSGYDIDIARNNYMKVIDFYHLSARDSRAALYSLLQNVVRSKSFANL